MMARWSQHPSIVTLMEYRRGRIAWIWSAGNAGLKLAELLRQRDEDSFRAAEITEAIHVLVLRHLAYELGSMPAQAGDHVVDVVDGEHDPTNPQSVHRCVLRLRA